MAHKSDVPLIEGQRVRLRLLTADDLPLTLAWRNQDPIRKWFFHSDVITAEQHQKWFDAYLLRDDDYVFIIEELVELRKPVGQVSLYHIDWQRRRAEFGRLMIGEPQAREKGLAREAVKVLINFAETTWRLKEIYLEVFENNLPAIRIYESSGFVPVNRTSGVIYMVRLSALNEEGNMSLDTTNYLPGNGAMYERD